MSLRRRLLLAASAVVACALTGLGAGAGPAAATALPIGQCTTTSGVILAVDFSHWGGPVLRSCGATPTTGMTLLNQGGWQSTGTHHDGPGFVCRISYSGFRGGAAYPTSGAPDYQACVSTPPSSAYWSYWHAAPGKNSWVYSQTGAGNYHPAAGSVDLWTFGGTSGPAFSPDSVRARNTSPSGGASAPPAQHSSTPPASHPGTPAGTATGSAGSSGSDSGMSRGPASSASASRAARATHSGTPTASKPGSGSASAAAGSATSSSGAPQIEDAAPAAATRHSAGSSRPAVLAGGLVLVLGGLAGVTGWRRRQAR